jgi:predicted heme/steroid binding protein
MTRQDLAHYDGKAGAPAFIACFGRIYDVSTSYHWRGGVHWVHHHAGCDLTESLALAPHGAESLERFPVVGALVDGP